MLTAATHPLDTKKPALVVIINFSERGVERLIWALADNFIFNTTILKLKAMITYLAVFA